MRAFQEASIVGFSLVRDRNMAVLVQKSHIWSKIGNFRISALKSPYLRSRQSKKIPWKLFEKPECWSFACFQWLSVFVFFSLWKPTFFNLGTMSSTPNKYPKTGQSQLFRAYYLLLRGFFCFGTPFPSCYCSARVLLIGARVVLFCLWDFGINHARSKLL